jgi:hypothetical protein
MSPSITVRKLHDSSDTTDEFNDNPEECLDIVERLRIEAGKFIYDYPTAFRRVVKVIRKKSS